MGLSQSMYEIDEDRSDKYTKALVATQEHINNCLSVLLWGLPNCGKSTIKHAMLMWAGSSYHHTEQYYIYIKEQLKDNLLRLMKQIIDYSPSYGEENETHRGYIKSFQQDSGDFSVLSLSIASILQTDKGVGEVVKNRYSHKYDFPDNADYLLSNFRRICDVHQIPSQRDALHVDTYQSSVDQSQFSVRGEKIGLIDPGRITLNPKWHSYFDAPRKALIYVVNLGDYDRTIEEEVNGEIVSMNALLRSMIHLGEVCHSQTFNSVSIILNKKDVFRSKLDNKIELRLDGDNPRFLDYEGGLSELLALDYIKSRFLAVLPAELRVPKAVSVVSITSTDPEKFSPAFTNIFDHHFARIENHRH